MTTDAPTASVIIPAYNAAATIGAAISGALTQTHPSVEVIVVDDGSTDATRAICEAYGDAITLLSIPNGGTAGARNAGLEAATGDFVVLCDSDDILLPPHVEAALNAWRDAGGGRRFVHADATLLTPGGIAHGRTVYPMPTPAARLQRMSILEGNFVSIFVVAPTTMMRELGGFADRYLEDWDLWTRAILAGWVAVPQPVPHALYRTGGVSKSSNREAVYAAEQALLDGVRNDPTYTLTPAERNYLDARLAAGSPRQVIGRAEEALREGRTEEARALFRQASSLWPSNRRLRIKAASLAVPGAPAVWQRRLGRTDAGLGRTSS